MHSAKTNLCMNLFGEMFCIVFTFPEWLLPKISRGMSLHHSAFSVCFQCTEKAKIKLSTCQLTPPVDFILASFNVKCYCTNFLSPLFQGPPGRAGFLVIFFKTCVFVFLYIQICIYCDLFPNIFLIYVC